MVKNLSVVVLLVQSIYKEITVNTKGLSNRDDVTLASVPGLPRALRADWARLSTTDDLMYNNSNSGV